MTNLVPASTVEPASAPADDARTSVSGSPDPSGSTVGKLAGLRPTITLHLKIRPEAYPWLNRAAPEVNTVWNFANATLAQAARPYFGPPRKLLLKHLDELVAGCGDHFERIGIDVAQRVNHERFVRGVQFKKTKLRFRKSFGSRRSLGWIPFKAANLRVKGNRLRFMGKTIRLFQMDRFLEHRNLKGAKLGCGNFAQNALG